MVPDILIFKRVEKKYLLTDEQHTALRARLDGLIRPDTYPKSTICSEYLDTPDFRLIRASMAATVYKEKLRLRSYNTPGQEDRVFLEIKKKFKGVVYKRRVAMPYAEAREYLDTGIPRRDTQIMREIDYAMHFYGHPRPAMLLCYEREAFVWKENPHVRLTLDRNVRYRTDDLHLSHGTAGKVILPEGKVLMEIKTDGGMPVPLSHILDEYRIYPTRFSKYKTAYIDRYGTTFAKDHKGEDTHG